ncbi:MAG: hypothetical protein EZS28_002338 [Streblomastix strix]|uniref:Uncharacterized protein n=1 Tax=Streblomastix strix TaxID=222440 RepID=A0A5J4X4J2_9EUKA|nr:MAG: hypothetical protein EZS28_002338 [Streblomastix strix]
MSNVSKGDYAYNAEDLLVWIYDTSWYETDQIVADQVTPASDSIRQESFETSNTAKDTATGEEGVANTYARSDHTHHVNLSNGLTYDGNITATKFIRTGELATTILCAISNSTTVDSKFSRTYSSGAVGYIRLCVFPKRTSTGALYISFQVYCCTNAIIFLGYNPNQTAGTISSQRSIVSTPTGELRVEVGEQFLQDNQVLMISADGNTLTFNGAVISGTDVQNNGDSSITYSKGKAVQWDINSTNTGGLYANGQNLYWNARTVLFSNVSQ